MDRGVLSCDKDYDAVEGVVVSCAVVKFAVVNCVASTCTASLHG